MLDFYFRLLTITEGLIILFFFAYLHSQFKMSPSPFADTKHLRSWILLLVLTLVWGSLQLLPPFEILPSLIFFAAVILTIVLIAVILVYFQRARSVLSEKEKQFRLLAENAQDLIYRLAIKPNLCCEYINDAAEILTGRPAEAYYQDAELLFKIVYPEDINLTEALDNPMKWLTSARTMRVLKPDKAIVWLEQRNVPIYDSSGQIAAFEGIARDITKAKEMEKELQFLSNHDGMTGLGNRYKFEGRLAALADDPLVSVGIILCDIDGLKLINDTLGHHMGDIIIKEAALLLRRHFRESDVICRIGGDEFAVILKNCTQKDMEASAVRLQQSLYEYNKHNSGLPLGLSVGSAYKYSGLCQSAGLFKRADQELYKNKFKQGNQTQLKIINTFIAALADREQLRESLSKPMQDLAVRAGEEIGLDQSGLHRLKRLAVYHDLGMLTVPKKLLYKKGPLSCKENLELRRHCEIGARIAKSTRVLEDISELILSHHERWDGDGYPRRIKGEAIPLECRILAVVCAYDAMLKKKNYREPLSKEEAIEQLRLGSEKQFDPQIVKVFLEVLATKTG